MKKKSANYFVIKCDGDISCDDKGNPQSFSTYDSALARARELAKCEPGTGITIAIATHITVAPVGSIITKGASE